jgi:predicted XRE-type DNA-binding protein
MKNYKILLTDEERLILRNVIRQSPIKQKDIAESLGATQSGFSNLIGAKYRSASFSNEEAKIIYEKLGEPEELAFLVEGERGKVERMKPDPLGDAYMVVYNAHIHTLTDAAKAMNVDDKKILITDLEGFVRKYTEQGKE